MSTGAVRRISEETLREFGVTPRTQIGGHLEDMRREASEAANIARTNEEPDLYLRLNKWVGEVGELQAVLAEKEAS